MAIKFNATIFVFICLFSCVVVRADVIKFEVFVDDLDQVKLTQPPQSEVTVFDLSAPEKLKRSMLPTFAADPEQAEKSARAFLASSAGKSFQQQLIQSYTVQIRLSKYQLAKIPAVVFENGTYVIYGTTDLALAMERYQNFIRDLKREGRAYE